MKVLVTKYTVMSVMLLASSAHFCHCTLDRSTFESQPEDTEKEMMKAYYQNLAIMESSKASVIQNDIVLESFKVGYEALVQATAPNTGQFALNLHGTGDNIVLHVVARYDSKVLILNTFQGGRWESEVRPSGFNFQPGISTILNVVARSDGFNIFQDDQLIASFPYRSGLPVDSVRRIRVISVDNQSAQNAYLAVRFA